MTRSVPLPGSGRTRRRCGQQSGGASAHQAAQRAGNPDIVDVAASHQQQSGRDHLPRVPLSRGPDHPRSDAGTMLMGPLCLPAIRAI
ncbi:MAG: hypothetical protein ACRDPW_08050 [Mycobacteriales bacterium]